MHNRGHFGSYLNVAVSGRVVEDDGEWLPLAGDHVGEVELELVHPLLGRLGRGIADGADGAHQGVGINLFHYVVQESFERSESSAEGISAHFKLELRNEQFAGFRLKIYTVIGLLFR